MRLFTAIDLPADILSRLDQLMAGLRPLAQLGWTPASNLHITTKFIGQWPEDRLPQLQRALAAVAQCNDSASDKTCGKLKKSWRIFDGGRSN